MTTAKWIIVNLGVDKDIQSLYYSVLENGREAQVVSLEEAANILETFDDTRQCVVTSGSIWFNAKWRKQRPNSVGCWHNPELFACNTYYGYYGKHIAQQNYIMMPFGDIEHRQEWLFSHFGEDLFIRPESGEKNFTGGVVTRNSFKDWYDMKFLRDGAKKSLLCIVAPKLKIKKELRLLIKDRKVITGSTYRVAEHIIREPLVEQSDQTKIIDFAEQILSEGDHHPNFPPVHTMDLALLETGYAIMEIHCCCCCGKYAMDMAKFSKAISEAAEKAFESN